MISDFGAPLAQHNECNSATGAGLLFHLLFDLQSDIPTSFPTCLQAYAEYEPEDPPRGQRAEARFASSAGYPGSRLRGHVISHVRVRRYPTGTLAFSLRI